MPDGTSPESFELDHNAVVAPYVRIAGEKDLRNGGHITKYDVRFSQPNREHLEMPTVHSIEHALATTLRWHSGDVIDISPMGCQTGFYVTVDGPTDIEAFLTLLHTSLEDVLSLDETPAATERQCGWAASHSIDGAKTAINTFLAARDEWTHVYTH